MKALVVNALSRGFDFEDVQIAAPVGREVLVQVQASGPAFALEDRMRAKAIASVSLWDLRVTAGEGWPAPHYDRTSVLVEIGKQRTAEARGLTVRRDDGIPKRFRKAHPRS